VFRPFVNVATRVTALSRSPRLRDAGLQRGSVPFDAARAAPTSTACAPHRLAADRHTRES
jgi:hypothetical protein